MSDTTRPGWTPTLWEDGWRIQDESAIYAEVGREPGTRNRRMPWRARVMVGPQYRATHHGSRAAAMRACERAVIEALWAVLVEIKKGGKR